MAKIGPITVPVNLELTEEGKKLIHLWVAESMLDLLKDDQFITALTQKVGENLAKQVRTRSGVNHGREL
jgi:hypothetical protein